MQPDDFDLLGDIQSIEVISRNRSIHEVRHLNHKYGVGKWRKLKGVALIRYKQSQRIVTAEIHWYEAHGIGAVKWKVKRELE
jgi:hypothetical protein